MRLSYILIPIIFIVLLLGSGSFFLYKTNYNKLVEDEILSHLENVAESKAERIKYYLDEKKDDVELLSTQNVFFESLDVKFLNNFVNRNNYENFFIVDNFGKIVYSYDLNFISKNVEDYSFLLKVFEKVEKDFGVGIYSPGEFDSKSLVFVTTPIYVNDDFGRKERVGFIFVQIKMEEIKNRILQDIGFGEMGEMYLVDRDGVLITKLNSEDDVERINTEMFRDCFSDYFNYYFELRGEEVVQVKKSGLYKNYLNDSVYGSHQYVLENGWCVMVEVSEKYFNQLVFENEKQKYQDLGIFLLIVFIVFSVSVLVFDRYIKLEDRK